MEFNKSRVYTSLNADEVKIGSKVYLSRSLMTLRRLVEYEDVSIDRIARIKPDYHVHRFVSKRDTAGDGSTLCYLLEEPEEPKEEDKLCTNRELSRWLVNGNGECLYNSSGMIRPYFYYEIGTDNRLVDVTECRIRKWGDSTWHEPSRKYMYGEK